MAPEEGTPRQTCLKLVCNYTYQLRRAMTIAPNATVSYAEELVRTKVFSEEETKVVERFKTAAEEFDRANVEMFFLGKKYGGDDR